MEAELKKYEDFQKKYKKLKFVGGGRFGKVYAVKDIKTGKKFAAKYVKFLKQTRKEEAKV